MSDGRRRWPSLRAGLSDEVGYSDGFVAVRAWSSGAKATAEDPAVVTPLLAEVAGVTAGALVDDRRLGQAGDQPERDLVRRTLAETEAPLAAGV